MFGFSLAELIVVFVVILIFIKPKDLPEIANFLGRALYHGKKWIVKIKSSLKELEKDFAIEELRNEINRGMAEEKAKLEEETTVIVDMYGNEHQVSNINEIRQDVDKQSLEKEILSENQKNLDKLLNKKIE